MFYWNEFGSFFDFVSIIREINYQRLLLIFSIHGF